MEPTFNIVYELTDYDQIKRAMELKIRVFHYELGLSYEYWFNPDDFKSIHFEMMIGEKIAGTCRLSRYLGNYLCAVAIAKEFRGKEYGRLLIEKAVEVAKKENYESVCVYSFDHTVPFYLKLGGTVKTPIFWDNEHRYALVELFKSS